MKKSKKPVLQIFSFAILLALTIASYLLPDSVKKVLELGYSSFTIGSYQLTLLQIVQTILMIVLLFWAVGLFIGIVERYLNTKSSFRASTRLLIIRFLQITLYFVSFLIIFSNLGIDLTALAIFSGTIGIGLGFGLQKIASNFISGIILSSEDAIKEGDLLELNDGTRGYVKKIKPRHILLEGLDQKEMIVPNEEFINNRVTNWTMSNNTARVDIPFGVAYGSDLKLVLQLVTDMAINHKDSSKDKPPVCYVSEFADSSINFMLFFWVKDINEGIFRVRSELLLSIWQIFEEQGIKIPFPQRDIHMHQV